MNEPKQSRALPFVLVLAGVAGLLAGCIDIEESLTLQRDLSGTARFSVTVDREPLVKQIALINHLDDGKAGDPTAPEVDMTRQQVLAAGKNERAEQEASFKEDLKNALPPGVKLLAMAIDYRGTKAVLHAEFAFDDVRMLPMIGMAQEVTNSWPTPNPQTQPFCGLEVVDEGKTVLVTQPEADPLERILRDPREPGIDPSASPEVRKQAEAALNSARLVFRIESPFEVVETNADIRGRGILSWEVRGSDPIAKRERKLMARFKK